LVRLGEYLNEARGRYVALLIASASTITQNLLGMELTLGYRAGWNKELSFQEALAACWPHDQETGTTQVGPQRAEIAIRLNGAAVKDRISRGQQKLLASALLMAQLSLFPREAALRPTLLLDDPAAELDSDRLIGLINEVSRQSVQLVVTSLNPDFSAFGSPGRRYGVMDGVLTEL
jgi:DNA replication and repair protein RecF